ncbi:uncharacterized protein LOC115807123 [Chanos chanos]|uniref:Uncharacterized protein LOC115807123 n=1 Tax=Chanos chanos TaxID=29144 RepID=A0A6J2UUV2_CHACN|nr:uncharacterized protein LOC115807123 [Chanos chanos]
MAAFVAHPSVRVKGSEHTYTPVLCQDEKCAGREKGVHMHCPLCSVAEAYQDPVILRAHYRIKHVDKGIDFAGLKVLRCCNHCEIVGTIKGEKRFKGAHWHCYRCRNGFNRRDEAIKHYKTHFRNPHTTFQIQVTQEVNCRQYYDQSPEAHPKAYSGLAVNLGSAGDSAAIGSVLTHPVLTTTTSTETLLTVEPKHSNASNGMSLGAEEEVGSSQHASEQTQTLVLMDPDVQGGNLIYEETTGFITEQAREGTEQTLLLQKQLIELHQQNEILRQEKDSVERRLRAEIQQLKDQVASLVRSNVKMFEELQLYRSPESNQDNVAKLLESLEAQHKELLLTQLASLRKELLCQTEALPLNGHTGVLEISADQAGPDQDGSGAETEVQESVGGALTTLEIVEMQLESAQENLKTELVELDSIQAETLPSLDRPNLDTAVTETSYNASEALEEVDGTAPPSSLRKRASDDESGETSDNKVQRVS